MISLRLFLFLALASPAAAWAKTVNFDFEDADLRAVIQAVAEFTGKNFLVDPAVKGKVTVVAPEPLTEDEAYRVFQSVLEVNGYATVASAGVIKIVPAAQGRTRGLPPGGGAASPGGMNPEDLVTRVIHLDHVFAERLVPILRPLLPAYGHLAADPKSASLILTDRAANVERLTGIIERLDRPARTGEVELVALTHASAEELAQLFNQLRQHEGKDENAAADGVAVIADARTNSLIIKADPDTRRELKALAAQLDSPAISGGDTQVIYLKNANAENLAEVLRSTIDAGPEGRGDSDSPAPRGLLGKINIRADAETNALIVTATKSDFAIVAEIIRKLDVRRLQVYVEALIAEVSTRAAQQLGVQFGVGDGARGDQQGLVGGTNFTLGASLSAAAVNPLATGAGFSLGFVDGTITLPDGTEIYNINVLAKALEDQTDANVLSTPNILTMDNEEAEIVVGQNVPFITGAYTQVGQGTAVQNPFQTIERRDVGLTLRIRPQITEGSAIKLEIFQEVSSVATQRGDARDLVTNTRSLTTTVVAENNQMLVLGGLIQDDISKKEQRVPLLGHIPVLGNLFRYSDDSRRRTNLLVFLRPQIIRGPKDMDIPTQNKYQYLDQLSRLPVFKESEEDASPLEEWELITGMKGPGAGSEEPAATNDEQEESPRPHESTGARP